MKEIRMSEKELKRIEPVERAMKGKMTIKEMSEMIGVGVRQGERIIKRVRDEGIEGLFHKGRGKESNRGYCEEIKEKVIELCLTRCVGWGPLLVAEKFCEIEGIKISDETIRRWMTEEEIEYKKRKQRKHRKRRERKEHFGEMVQMDGSFHEWFTGRGEKFCLMVMIDDATSKRMAYLCKEETTRAAMIILRKWVERYGVPKSLYTDKRNVYILDGKTKERLNERGEEGLTQFGKVCKKLGIEIIPASSPQAKGRVERANGVFQDRFIKEVAFREIKEVDKAKEFLEEEYLDMLNKKYEVFAKSEVNFHKGKPDREKLDVIFVTEEERSLANDWTVRYKNRVYQVLSCNRNLRPTQSKIQVLETLKGEIRFFYRGQEMEVKDVTYMEREKKVEKAKRTRRRTYKPSANHPWRRMVITQKGMEQRQ